MGVTWKVTLPSLLVVVNTLPAPLPPPEEVEMLDEGRDGAVVEAGGIRPIVAVSTNSFVEDAIFAVVGGRVRDDPGVRL